MGKASRTKRERREDPTPAPTVRGRRQLPVFWIAIAALIAAGIATLVITAPDDKEKRIDAAAAKVPSFATVTTSGDPLPTWKGSGSDSAEGTKVPSIRAEKLDGFRTVIAPNDGIARVYIVVAHWCPHCQAEVPRIVKWTRSHDIPEGVEVVALSTAVDESQPNFPPAAWLAREKWPFETLIDDELGSGAEALGVEGFPFLVFTDMHGTVTSRFSGEMPIDEFGRELLALAPDEVPAAKR